MAVSLQAQVNVLNVENTQPHSEMSSISLENLSMAKILDLAKEYKKIPQRKELQCWSMS